ncbi:hypothetical protein DFH29DRAFT_908954 [Suillus ampliporus]|nr:hypothetical protein DFH29DRAFT_908954 [Suillus ampliporus]
MRIGRSRGAGSFLPSCLIVPLCRAHRLACCEGDLDYWWDIHAKNKILRPTERAGPGSTWCCGGMVMSSMGWGTA